MGAVETDEEGRAEWLEMPRGIPEKHQQFRARERPQQERWAKHKETGRREPGGPRQRVMMRLCTLLVLAPPSALGTSVHLSNSPNTLVR